MHNRSGNGRTHSSSQRPTARRLTILAISAVGAGVIAASSANADPAGTGLADGAGTGTTSPAYQLGYHQTFSDYEIIASRMRAEGFTLEDIDISSRVPAVCANEAQSVQSTPELTGPDFTRGCADAVESLVEAGIAS